MLDMILLACVTGKSGVHLSELTKGAKMQNAL